MIYKAAIAVAILTCSLSGIGYAQESEFVLRESEALNDFGTRVIPKGMKLAHNVVKGDFGQSTGNIVVLFHDQDGSGYSGWVFIPQDISYKKYVLPKASFAMYSEVEAVFFANVDSDSDRELLILCKGVSGAGRSPGNVAPFWSVYFYDWNGTKFKKLDDDLPEKLDEFTVQREFRTVQAIRKRLKELGYLRMRR